MGASGQSACRRVFVVVVLGFFLFAYLLFTLSDFTIDMRASLRFSLLGAALTEQMSVSNTAACAGYGHADVKGVGNVLSPVMVGKWLSLQVQEHACLLQDALCSVFNYSLACETPAFFMEMNETGDSYLFESPTRNAAVLCWHL